MSSASATPMQYSTALRSSPSITGGAIGGAGGLQSLPRSTSPSLQNEAMLRNSSPTDPGNGSFQQVANLFLMILDAYTLGSMEIFVDNSEPQSSSAEFPPVYSGFNWRKVISSAETE